MTAPSPGTPNRSQASTMFRLSGVLLIGALLWSANDALDPLKRIGDLLGGKYAQAAGIDPAAKLALLIHCLNEPLCQAWTEKTFLNLFGEWHVLLLLAAVVPLVVLPFLKGDKAIERKEPGSAAWVKVADVPQYRLDAETPETPHAGYLGQMMELEPNRKLAVAVEPLFLSEENWCQNTIIQGGVGSGKTTGFFQANGALAAHLGHSLIVIDTKWPQSDSGMREMLGYWHKLGRPVQLWTPFEPQSLRLPMDEDIKSFEEGLRFADAVMPPPEFQDEVGAHFKQTQRRVLAAQARANAMDGGNIGGLQDIALKTLDDHKKWIEELDTSPDQPDSVPERRKLKLIMQGALSRGDRDFMDSMAAIISALRVFFSENVLRACTAGTKNDTIVLETALREPTLVYVAMNQEDMLDGSGTILIRLFFRRLIQAALRVARTSKDGKLPHLTTFLMDEQPSYGRVNYLMRISAMMRSYRFALVFGIQANSQGRLVYGQEYWNSISENVISRRIAFPRGLSGEDARDISERIGYTTVVVEGASVSSGGGLLGAESRTSQSSTLKAQPLLPVEEFSDFGVGEAVIISSHHKPIRTAFTPITFPTMKNARVKPGTENWIHRLYRSVMGDETRSLAQISNDLVNAGTFTTLTLDQWNSNYLEGQRTSTPTNVRPQAAGSNVQTVDNDLLFREWAVTVAEQGARVALRTQPSIEHIDIETKTLPQAASDIQLFLGHKLLEQANEFNVRVTALGKEALAKEDGLLQTIRDLADLFPIWDFIRAHAEEIEGTPERAALPESSRMPYIGILRNKGQTDETLLVLGESVHSIYAREGIPAFARDRVRKGSRDDNFYVLPTRNAAAIREAKTTGSQKQTARSNAAEQKIQGGSAQPGLCDESGVTSSPPLPRRHMGPMEDL